MGQRWLVSVSVALASLAATGAGAQQPAAAPAPPTPNIGEMAPDFVLPAATRYGLLREPVKLSSLRGQTVVLAFFFKARTKG
jgi:cytochrome oxidase Cu insertion factor (SCO1/SenC/PrrC family)